VSDRDGNPEIYTMRQGGEEQFRLTNNSSNDFWPAYAPNSSGIVFSSNRLDVNNPELYVMKIDGTSQERITIDAAQDDHPHWGVYLIGQQPPSQPTATTGIPGGIPGAP
jgi:TolB protein